MNAISKAKLTFVVFLLLLTSITTAKTQATDENMKTFLDSEMPGIKIQINATVETQPSGNITVTLSLRGLNDISVDHFDLSMFGFLNGTEKRAMANITQDHFSINHTSKEYNTTFTVPSQVWGITFGEFSLTYSADLGGMELKFPNIKSGFYMTNVKNTFLENLETQLKSLNESYHQLNSTYWQLQQNYTSLQSSIIELDSTRRVAVILAITTVFFVATTLFLVMRKPREPW
jgi:hypothetical protein